MKPEEEEGETTVKMRDVGISVETKELARELFTTLISLDDVDTVEEIEALMEDSIDLAIEFELKLKKKRITVLDETEIYW